MLGDVGIVEGFRDREGLALGAVAGPVQRVGGIGMRQVTEPRTRRLVVERGLEGGDVLGQAEVAEGDLEVVEELAGVEDNAAALAGWVGMIDELTRGGDDEILERLGRVERRMPQRFAGEGLQEPESAGGRC